MVDACTLNDIWSRMDCHQGQAAWAQAFFTVAAVFATAWLQNRVLAQRDAARRNERLEIPATAARFALERYRALLRRVPVSVPPALIAGVIHDADFRPGIEAMSLVEVAELGDTALFGYVLQFKARLQAASDEILGARDAFAGIVGTGPVNLHDIIAQHEVELFNAAASVERRVAELVGRLPLE